MHCERPSGEGVRVSRARSGIMSSDGRITVVCQAVTEVKEDPIAQPYLLFPRLPNLSKRLLLSSPLLTLVRVSQAHVYAWARVAMACPMELSTLHARSVTRTTLRNLRKRPPATCEFCLTTGLSKACEN